MNKISQLLLVSTLLILSACTTSLCGKTGTANSQVLLDGANGLEQWNMIGNANWHKVDNEIVADSGEGFLISKETYKDFHLVVEFWADHTANSGVFLRLSDTTQVTSANAYEVNIYDQRPDPRYGTGAIVDLAAVEPMPKAGGQWNRYEITAQGTHLVVVLNGVETANIQDSKLSEGPIGLQFGSVPAGQTAGAMKWRKVVIERL